MKDPDKPNPFKEIIKEYLDKRAKEDPLFAPSYAKPTKNIDDCCKYIIEEARKRKDGSCAVIKDEEVFGWAVHYYDEDDIEVPKATEKVTVSTTATTEPPKEKKKEFKQLTIFDMLGE